MGLIAEILKEKDSNSDCSLNGISNRFKSVCIVNADGPFEPTEDIPGVEIIKGYGSKNTVRAVPLEIPKGRHSQFGGCFIATSDSRFTELIENITGQDFYGAVALHDRLES